MLGAEANVPDSVQGEQPTPAPCGFVYARSPVGNPHDAAGLAESGLPIIEDITTLLAAAAVDPERQPIGRFLLVSLEEDSIITGGGGAIVLARSNRDLGSLRKAAADLPRSSLLPDLNASLAANQLGHLSEFLKRRSEIAQVFTRAVQRTTHTTLTPASDGVGGHYSFAVLVGGSMKEAIAHARARKVETRPAFEDAIMGTWQDAGPCDLPNARLLYLRCLLFPLYPLLDRDSVRLIARILATLP
jgi:dTDP-4-amino-4,6-dideoxygalactose transaminase